jgi:hypothetical protein
MKASKFPVTYRGEEFRVSVEEVSLGFAGKVLQVKVYIKRSGELSRIFKFRQVAEVAYKYLDEEIAVSASALAAVRGYVKTRDEKIKRQNTEQLAWRNFAEWDGVITDE